MEQDEDEAIRAFYERTQDQLRTEATEQERMKKSRRPYGMSEAEQRFQDTEMERLRRAQQHRTRSPEMPPPSHREPMPYSHSFPRHEEPVPSRNKSYGPVKNQRESAKARSHPYNRPVSPPIPPSKPKPPIPRPKSRSPEISAARREALNARFATATDSLNDDDTKALEDFKRQHKQAIIEARANPHTYPKFLRTLKVQYHPDRYKGPGAELISRYLNEMGGSGRRNKNSIQLYHSRK